MLKSVSESWRDMRSFSDDILHQIKKEKWGFSSRNITLLRGIIQLVSQ